MCGSAYSLLKLLHGEDEKACRRAKKLIEELPADGRQKLQAVWEAFKHIAKDGELFRDKELTIFLNWQPELAGKSLDISAVSAVVSDVQYPEMREWIPKAEAGDAEACYKLAEYILAEQQCDNEYREDIEWIEDGNYRHDGEALKWYLLAAWQGHGMAQWKLAWDVYSDSGWCIDYENQFFWSVKGSQNKELSDKRRLHLLSEVGYAYIYGPDCLGRYPCGAEQDLDYGYSLIRRAISNGSDAYLDLLGDFYGKENEVRYERIAFTKMCGGAYSLLVLSNSKDESVREKVKAAIAKLPEERRQLIYRFWDEFKKQTEDGKLFHDGEITIFLRKQEKLLDYEKQDISSVAKLITTKKETLGDYMTVDEMMQRIYDLEKYTKSMGEDAPLWLKMLADNGDAFCQYVLGKWFAESPDFIEPCRSFMKARHWLTLAAEQGYLAAKEDLIKLYKSYEGHDGCAKEAFKWSKDALTSGAEFAYRELVDCYLNGIGVEKNIRKAVPIMEQMIAKEFWNQDALNCLCEYYNGCHGGVKDPDKVKHYKKLYYEHIYYDCEHTYGEWLKEKEQLAADGDGEAAREIFKHYWDACIRSPGANAEADAEKMVEWGEKCVALNPEKAVNTLQMLAWCFQGNDDEKCRYYYQRAVDLEGEEEKEDSRYYLVDDYMTSKLDVAPENVETVYALLAEGVRHKQGWSMRYLANWYAEGKYVERDVEKATALLEEAIRNKDTYSITTLANWYAEGKYVKRDLGKAVALLIRAPETVSDLVKWYAEGKYVEKNIAKAVELMLDYYAKHLQQKTGYEKKSNFSVRDWPLSDVEKEQLAAGLIKVIEKEVSQGDRVTVLRIVCKDYVNNDSLLSVIQTSGQFIQYGEALLATGEDKCLAFLTIFKAWDAMPDTSDKVTNAIKYLSEVEAGGFFEKLPLEYVDKLRLRLAKYYHIGFGVPQNDTKALQWYDKVHDAVSLAEIYRFYRDGIGVAKDENQATEFFYRIFRIYSDWYKIGDAYRIGKYVVPNEKEALFWYREAQRCGHELSQEALDFIAEHTV